MVETLSHLYTSQPEIERIMTAGAAMAHADDLGVNAAEDEVWNDIIYEATDTVNLYLEKFYNPEDMKNNLWIRRTASWIGAFLLPQRGGDPGYFATQYERIIKVLEKVGIGSTDVHIPRLPFKADFTPAMSNLYVDDRYSVRKLRVRQEISTGGTSSRQDLAPDVFLY